MPIEEGTMDLGDHCLHRLFEQQALRRPGHIALQFQNRHVTYRELNESSSRLARRLQTLGVGRNTAVGVLVERNPETIVGLLAVLKAGGAYVPIDPAFPRNRIDYILQHTESPILLAHSDAAVAGSAFRGRIVNLQALDQSAPGPVRQDAAAETTAADPAYIIYTSGSTGTPKGVAVQHHTVRRLLEWMIPTYRVGPQSTVIQSTTLCFDVSVWEVFGSLISGAKLTLLENETLQDPSSLLHWLDAVRATHFSCVPSLFNLLMDTAAQQEKRRPGLKALQWLMPAGEALKPRPVVQSRRLYPHVQIANLYGPTEATVYASYYHLPAGPVPSNIPIGRALPHIRLYVLDPDHKPLPAGSVGELGITGDCLALGYWKDPARTSQVFIPNPFEPGTRLHLTGDLVCLRPDGELEYLGRRDTQVKVRGFRIELGEIENALLEKTGIKECAVTLANRDEHSDLTAYYTSRRSLSIQSLRAFLAARVPAYMIPQYFIPLEKMPLTQSGKIDRQALPEPRRRGARAVRGSASSGNPTERRLAAIWSEVLEIDRVRPEDNFFELGGHSLKAMQIVARLQQAFRIPLTVRTFLEKPTFKNIVSIVTLLAAAPQGSEPMPAPRRAGHKSAYALSEAEKGLWLDCRIQPNPWLYNEQSMFAIQGPFDQKALIKAFKLLVKNHESLRTVFIEVDSEPMQKILRVMDFQLSLHDLSSLPDIQAKQTALEQIQKQEGRRPFDLAQGPLFRVALVHTHAETCYGLITSHHLITDDWSQREFYQYLTDYYQAVLEGTLPALRPPSLRYVDYTEWHNRLIQTGQGRSMRDYWRKCLSGELQALDLPYDHLPGRGAKQEAAVSAVAPRQKTAKQIQRLCAGQQVTPFMFSLAVFKILIMKYTGQNDLLVGVPIALRNKPEFEKMLGYFVNLMPIRSFPDGNLTFLQYLAQVKQKTLEALQNRDYPFYRMLQDLDRRNRPDARSLLTVTFQMEDAHPAHDQPKTIQGALFQEPVWVSHYAKYDLSVLIKDQKDRLLITYEYNPNLFTDRKIRRMLKHHRYLLQNVLSNPGAHIRDLSIIDPKEKNMLLHRFNNRPLPVCQPAVPVPTSQGCYRQSTPAAFAGLMQKKEYQKLISAKLAVREIKRWKMLVAQAAIAPQEILIKFGFSLVEQASRTSLQIDATNHMEIPGLDVTNHSCAPNAYIDFKKSCLRSLRAIRAEEEITFHYLTTEWDLSHPFRCRCNSGQCLMTIQGYKHLDPAQKKKLEPYLSPFLRTRAHKESVGYGIDKQPVTAHQLFEQRARAHPHKIAVRDWEKEWTYAELDRRADHLAQRLRDRPGSPGAPVALMLENSVSQIGALLAVLKAGRAFVPLDPHYPAGRLSDMLKDTRPAFILTQPKFKQSLPPVYKGKIIYPDTVLAGKPLRKKLDRRRKVDPEQTAYILYTSGTTGKPKGVCVAHRSLVNYLLWLNKNLFRAAAVIPLLNNITFDASLEQIFGALAGGGTLVIPRDIRNLPEVAGLIQGRVNAFSVVPSYLHMIIQYLEEHCRTLLPLQNIRTIYIGGEDLLSGLLAKMRKMFPRAAIYNGYGPTEATIASHCYRIKKDNRILLGRPINHVRTYILDQHNHPAPVGIKGEICIAGAGLAQGYLNDPIMTGKKFPANPFDPRERIYRTGDLGRYLADGRIEFCGRMDRQIKIRGLRIELGEIETRLREYAPIKECVVDLKQKDREKILIAYYQSKEELPVTALRAWLAEYLPGYMIPSFFMRLTSLPLTSSNKIDRRALPEPADLSGPGHGTPLKPRNPLEKKVLPIWQEILGLRSIGVRDNFFQLGGHSLSAAAMLMKVNNRFHCNTHLHEFFINPTIEDLARQIAKADTGTQRVFAIRTGEKSRVPFFMVHGAGGQIHHFQELGRNLDAGQPFYALKAKDPDKQDRGFESIEEMARAYLAEIRKIQPRGPYRLGGWSMGGLIACEMAYLLEQQQQSMDRLIICDTYYSEPLQDLQKSSRDDEQKIQKNRTAMAAYGMQIDHFNLRSPEGRVLLRIVGDHFKAGDGYLLKPIRAPLDLILPSRSDGAQARRSQLAFWRKYSAGPLEVHKVPGDHFSMFIGENAACLGRVVQQILDRSPGMFESGLSKKQTLSV